jgi:hypothetical protein
MTTCGLCLSRRRLVAVVVDDEGRAAPALVAVNTDDALWGLLEHLDAVHGLDCELVLPEDLLKLESLSRFARERGQSLWVAPQRLVDAIRDAAGFGTGPPARIAAMVARLLLVPGFRGHLRRPQQHADRRQLPLL